MKFTDFKEGQIVHAEFPNHLGNKTFYVDLVSYPDLGVIDIESEEGYRFVFDDRNMDCTNWNILSDKSWVN